MILVPIQENGVIRMKSFASWHPAWNIPVYQHRRREMVFQDSSGSWLPFEALTSEDLTGAMGESARSPSQAKTDIISSSVEMMDGKMMGMDGSDPCCSLGGRLVAPALAMHSAGAVGSGIGAGACDSGVRPFEGRGLDLFPAAISSICEGILW